MNLKALLICLVLLTVSTNALETSPEFLHDLIVGSWRVVTALFEDLTTSHPPMEIDAYKSDGEVFQSNGYRFEEHKVPTPDDYILSAWRIPGKISEPMKDIWNKPSVVLQHGLLDNSATWTINYFNQTLPYVLLEAGYDVWITNTRGNFNSYEHMNPFNYSIFNVGSDYWNFTFDDMAKYDLPANIDYILDYTGNEKVTYVGHSQGTIQFFGANCLQNLASKIEAFVGVGPVMYTNHAYSPLAAIGAHLNFDKVLRYFHYNNILVWPKIVNVPLNSVINKIRKTIWRFIQLICGVGEEVNIDLQRMPVMGRHEPGGSSLNNMAHWLQNMKTGKFEMMDYGEEENIRVYGQVEPPLYNTTRMEENLKDLDIYLIRGASDGLVSEEDFGHLLSHFENRIGKNVFYDVIPTYGHLDYIWAKDSLEKVNKPILKFLKDRKM